MTKKQINDDKNPTKAVLPAPRPEEPEEPEDDYYEENPEIARYLEMIENGDYYDEDDEDYE